MSSPKTPDALLKIEDLSVHFRMHDPIRKQVFVEAVQGVDLDTAPGECVGLVGESGSGKSVTAHSILKLLPYPRAFHPGGRILFRGQDLLPAGPERIRAIRGGCIAMIFQEPMTALNPLHTVEKQIRETLRLHQGLGKTQARERCLELLDQVGIPQARQRLDAYPHQLSGGQRQRVMIAMALANEPELLIADEPTTALDVSIQAQILDLLNHLREQTGLALLLISHDLDVVRRMAARVYVMHQGRVVESGPTESLFYEPRHPYTQRLLASQPSGEPPAPPDHPRPLLNTRALKVWFPLKSGFFRRTPSYVKAVDEVALDIGQGQSVGIVGESGSGKSTLALALLRLIRSRGTILYQGNPIHNATGKSLRALRAQLQIVFQDPFASLSPRLLVEDIVAEGLQVHAPDLTRQQREAKVMEALYEVQIDPTWRHRFPHEFSGGQRQRIAIARALVLRPAFLVLDEPTSALDVSVQAEIVALLRKLREELGLTYLFISHDLRVVRALCDTILVMKDGIVVERGSAREILEKPQEAYTRMLIEAANLDLE